MRNAARRPHTMHGHDQKTHWNDKGRKKYEWKQERKRNTQFATIANNFAKCQGLGLASLFHYMSFVTEHFDNRTLTAEHRCLYDKRFAHKVAFIRNGAMQMRILTSFLLSN